MIALGKVEKRLNERKKKGTILAALIDPEDYTPKEAASKARVAERAGASLILIGGSTISNQARLDSVVIAVKAAVTSHVVLFPGNITGVSHHADAILFSSLLNSTNPYFIVGAQALGSIEVYKSGIESIPMGYLVFGSGSATGFIAQVNGLPPTKSGLAVIYSLAARYLGMRSLYLEAGSGSSETVPPQTVSAVRKYFDGILLVGGGITTPEAAVKAARAGADVVVVGNLLQTDMFEDVLVRMSKALKRNKR